MDYVIATRELGPQSIFAIRDRHAPPDLPGFLSGGFGELVGRLGLLGVRPAGHPFVIYHALGPAHIEAEVCVPIAEAASAAGRIESRELAAMTVARTLHVGPYEDLGAAYRALTERIPDRGRDPDRADGGRDPSMNEPRQSPATLVAKANTQGSR